MTGGALRLWLAIVLGGGFAAACGGGRAPATHYYDLASAARRHAGTGPVLAVEALEADEPYDDDRIVYRENPYRVDYYHYHRWSAPPGAMVGRHLERALAASGRFGAVLREPPADGAAYVLGGRVLALEEVDVSRRRWLARVALELHLRDARTGDVVWSRRLEETEPVARQSPEGVARALSRALDRVARRLAPELGRVVRLRSCRGACPRRGASRSWSG
ncbi:MAG TPA: ABC-type transport auxiliary lipoprotein family protein [Kofleriaceae bacterium]|nr:ABC-type transport auxiliary lipoprotein family protein [Kofleriaceae bacterium]